MKIEKDQLILTGLWQNVLFHKRRGQGHYLSYLKNRIQWFWYPPLKKVAAFPPHVDIEISTQCNMACPMCYRRTKRFQNVIKPQFMEKSLFEKIIKECGERHLFSIRLSLRGEPFIHPDVLYFVRLAKEVGIKEVSSLSNGLALTPEKFEALVDAQFDWLTISFDGLGETYESIRKPAKFDEALEKIKTYSEIKKRRRSIKPALRVQTVWPAIKNDPEKFYKTFEPYVDSITSNPLIDFLQQDTDITYDTGFECPFLYQRLVVGADGKVLLCTCDDYGDNIIGDARTESIYDIWHGEKMQAARAWFSKKTKKWWETDPCKHCFYPRKKEQVSNAVIEGRKVNVHKYLNRSDEIFFDE